MVDSVGGEMDQAATLLKIQELDLETRRDEKLLDEMPEKKAILETRAKTREIQALHAKAEELVARLGREVTRNEDETTSVSEKIEAEQARVMSGDITNAKEIQHLTREIDSLKRRREKLEMEQLTLLERVEKAKGQVAKVETGLKHLEVREAELVEEFQAKGGALQTGVEAASSERDTLAKGLDAELLAQYEGFRQAKGGVGVGLLKGDACTACRMELPAERVEELRSGPRIATCPQCRRLIVVDPGDGESDA
jgi:predicted  nucleic acid-binding Zn-ribbon protein